MLSTIRILRRMSTVDPAEKLVFSSYKWWSSNDALHPYTDVRINFIKNCLGLSGPKPFANMKILDVGCGGGLVTERLARLGGTVVGIDPTPEAIDVAQDHLPTHLKEKVEYKNCEVAEVEGTFDLVVASEVLEHVNTPDVFLKQVADKAIPGGSVILTTVNRTLDSYLLAIYAAENILGLVEPGTHHWDKFITIEEFKELCRNASLDPQELKGWFLDYLRFTAFETDYQRIGYMCRCIKLS